MFSTVPSDIWKFEGNIDSHRKRYLLCCEETPIGLVEKIKEKCISLKDDNQLIIELEPSEASTGCRINTKITVNEILFDKFFNGPSGYRAQYYFSPEIG